MPVKTPSRAEIVVEAQDAPPQTKSLRAPDPARMKQRVLHALAAFLSGHVIISVGNLLLVPLFLAHWSTARYGEWLALYSLVNYLMTLDLGLNPAVVNRLTQAFSRGDLEEYRRTQHSAMAFYVCLAAAGSLLLALAGWALPLTDWLGLNETSRAEGAWTLWLLGQAVLWGYPAFMASVVYRSTGHLARDRWAFNTCQIIAMATTALVLVLGKGMIAAALAQLLALAIVTGGVVWDLRRRSPDLLPGVRQRSLSVLKGLVRPSLAFGLIVLANGLALQGSVVLASAALGGAAVALFVTSRTLANLIRQVVLSLIGAVWPELTRMEALGEWGRLRAVHRQLMMGTALLCVGAATAIWFEGLEIIGFWTGGKLQPDATLLRLLLVMVVLQCPWQVSLVFSAAANRHGKLARSQLLASVIGLGLAGLLMPTLGIYALPVGLTIGEAVACYHFIVRDTCRMLGEPYRAFAIWLWGGLATVSGAALTGGWLAHASLRVPSPLDWVGVGAAGMFSAAAAAWLVWLTPTARRSVRVRIATRSLRVRPAHEGT
jgi:O-antigen/teichoic acid export membrane protein